MLASHDTLANFLKTNFTLVQFHKYSLSDIETMMPWERIVYVDMLNEHQKRESEARRDREYALKQMQGSIRRGI